MNQLQQRDAERAIKEINQALDAIGSAHQVVEISKVHTGDIYNGEEQMSPSVVVRFYPRFDGTAAFVYISDALTSTTS